MQIFVSMMHVFHIRAQILVFVFQHYWFTYRPQLHNWISRNKCYL